MGDNSEIVRSKDPNLMKCRLFVGNWPADKPAKELNEYFQKYGPVLGTFIHEKNYAFVQFSDYRHAQEAMACEQNACVGGRSLSIKVAKDSGGAKETSQAQQKGILPLGSIPTPSMMQQSIPSLLYSSTAFDRPPLYPTPAMDVLPPTMQQSTYAFTPIVPAPSRRPDSPPLYHRPIQDHYAHDIMARREPVGRAPDPAYSSPTPDSGPPIGRKNDTGYERPFDAAIIFSSGKLRIYAEMIERRLTELNLTVDVIFVLEADKESQVLEAMAKRGILYVVVLQAQHELHKSITVNIIHGTPQEHRNIPLDDALVMLARDSNAYLSNLRAGSELPSICFLTHLLSDGKNLARPELDRIIDHLQDRRDRIIRAENQAEAEKAAMNVKREAPVVMRVSAPPAVVQPAAPQIQPQTVVTPKPAEPPSAKSSSQELQQKILSILGGAGGLMQKGVDTTNLTNMINATIDNKGGTSEASINEMYKQMNTPAQEETQKPEANQPIPPSPVPNPNPSMPNPNPNPVMPNPNLAMPNPANLFTGNLNQTLQNLLQNPESLRNLMSSAQKSMPATAMTTSMAPAGPPPKSGLLHTPPSAAKQNGGAPAGNEPAYQQPQQDQMDTGGNDVVVDMRGHPIGFQPLTPPPPNYNGSDSWRPNENMREQPQRAPNEARPSPTDTRPDATNPSPSTNMRGAPGDMRGSPADMRSLSADMRGPSADMRGPPADMRGPPGDMRGPPGDMRGPPGDMRGPSGDMRGPPGDMRGPPGDMRGPPGDMRGPPGDMRGPPGDMRGPSGDMRGPSGDIRGPTGDMRGLSDGDMRGPPGDMRGPSDGDMRAPQGHMRGPAGDMRGSGGAGYMGEFYSRNEEDYRGPPAKAPMYQAGAGRGAPQRPRPLIMSDYEGGPPPSGRGQQHTRGPAPNYGRSNNYPFNPNY